MSMSLEELTSAMTDAIFYANDLGQDINLEAKRAGGHDGKVHRN